MAVSFLIKWNGNFNVGFMFCRKGKGAVCLKEENILYMELRECVR